MLGPIGTSVLPSGSTKSANNGNIEFASAGLKRKQLHTEKGDTAPSVQKVCSFCYRYFFPLPLTGLKYCMLKKSNF